MRDQERAPRKYELMTILHPDVAEESLPGELDRISGFITAAGGELFETLQDSPWGRRRLAYPIRSGGRDVRDGYYTVWRFTLGPTRVDDLERELKLDTQLIRYIVLSWEPTPIDPKAVEAAEIAAEDAAAAAYAAAQAAAAAAEDDAAEAYAASQAAAATAEPRRATQRAPSSRCLPRKRGQRCWSGRGRGRHVDAAGGGRDSHRRADGRGGSARGDRRRAGRRAGRSHRGARATRSGCRCRVGNGRHGGSRRGASGRGREAEPDDVPAGAVRGDGTGECPEDYPIKGNATSKLYHSPGSPSYKRTVPEYCFATTEAAEAAGFNPTKYEAAHEDGE